MTTFFDEVMQQAASFPKLPAIVDHHGSISFADLKSQVETLTSRLADQGVEPGMGIGVVARNGRDFLIPLLAILGRGAVAVPISHQLKAAEAKTIADDIGLHGWISESEVPGLKHAVTTLLPGVHGDLFFSWSAHCPTASIASHINHPAIIRFTSGTTGKAKGVILSHECLMARTEAAAEALRLKAGEKVLWVLPMAYHFAVTCLTYLRFGVTTVVSPDLLAKSIFTTAEKHEPDYLYAAPMHIKMLANSKLEAALPGMRRVFSTSAHLASDAAKAFGKKFDIQVEQLYGMIEMGIPMLAKPGAQGLGYPCPGFEAKLFNSHGHETDEGELGFRGPGMFDGYLSPSVKSQSVLNNSWLMTGDLGIRNSDGSISLCGRKKSMINISGTKVFPEEVEAILFQHDAVADCRVFGKRHPMFGEIVAAEVVMQADSNAGEEDLIRFCRNLLSAYKIPQSISVVSAITKTPTGKPIRHSEVAQQAPSRV